MTTITVQLDTPVRRSFRVEQIAGMFDVPIEERMRHELTAEAERVPSREPVDAGRERLDRAPEALA